MYDDFDEYGVTGSGEGFGYGDDDNFSYEEYPDMGGYLELIAKAEEDESEYDDNYHEDDKYTFNHSNTCNSFSNIDSDIFDGEYNNYYDRAPFYNDFDDHDYDNDIDDII